MILSKLTIRILFFIAIISNLTISCKSKSTEKSRLTEGPKQISSITYGESDNNKCRLILNADNSFYFISINENDILRLDYFTTNGLWSNFGDTIILNSKKDTLTHQPALLNYDTIGNSGNSQFSFQDIYEDSIAAWDVLYPDGRIRSNGTTDQGASNYHWQADMKKYKFLEFDFSGYPNFRYIAPDSNVYKVNIKLLPKYIPDYFKNTMLIRKNDTLIWNTKNETRLFVLLK